jgi:serine/threonine-protein kinase
MLVHRDVKPQNVLIDPEGRAKVTDFGIALSLESGGLTKTGRVLGTTDYVSPEQAMGHGIDARSDVYSLGVLLYEMLTGDVPFKAETQVGVAMKHVNEPLPNVQRQRPEVSATLAAVIDRATAKDPRDRFANIPEMLSDLEEALDVEVARAGGSQGEVTNVLESVPPKRRRITGRRVSVAGILLVLAAIGVAIFIAARVGSDEPTPHGSEPATPATGAPIQILSTQDFDPPPGGDNTEHTAEANAGNAIDGDPDTVWPTETYEVSANIQDAAGKPGVGLILETKEPVQAHQLKVQSTDSGWDFDVYAASGDAPPTSLDGWGEPIGGASNAATDQTVSLNGAGPANFYLLWITKLASGPEGFVVEIEDVELTT